MPPRLVALLGQPDASAFLTNVVASNRYANAYLFHGPAGVGKGTAALAFARAILCDRGAGATQRTLEAPPEEAPGLFDAPAATAKAPAKKGGAKPAGADAAPAAPPAASPAPPEDGAPKRDACGACDQCAKAAALQHPDLKFLFPVSGEEKELDETINAILVSLRENPLHVFEYQKADSIRLSMTRELLRELAFRPYEAERRVVIVRDADRMREDQCSAMLKSIEEPGASTVWVLTTSRPNRLPATIRSRCQKVRFASLAETLVREFLLDRAGVDEKTARMLAALAGGSLARAIVLRDQNPLAMRDEALALLQPALRGDAAGTWAAAQKYMRFGKTGREQLRRMVEFHQLWLRDLLRARYGAPVEMLVNRDRVAEIQRQAAGVDATEIRRRLNVLEEMQRAIEGNVAADAAMFSGMMRVAGARFGEGEWPRHAAARWDY